MVASPWKIICSAAVDALHLSASLQVVGWHHRVRLFVKVSGVTDGIMVLQVFKIKVLKPTFQSGAPKNRFCTSHLHKSAVEDVQEGIEKRQDLFLSNNVFGQEFEHARSSRW